MARNLVSLAFETRNLVFATLGIATTGVRIAVFGPDRTQVLLIRHRYGPGDWRFPGGGIKRGESPAEAACRELGEETSIRVASADFVGRFLSHEERRPDTIHLFTATGSGIPRPDSVEIADAAWFDLSLLPVDTDAATRHHALALSAGAAPAPDVIQPWGG